MWRGTMSRGSRGMAGSKALGFHPGMVSGDTYGFDRIGMGPVDGFAMPDMFTAPASQGRGFPPYGQPGPRFGPASGINKNYQFPTPLESKVTYRSSFHVSRTPGKHQWLQSANCSGCCFSSLVTVLL